MIRILFFLVPVVLIGIGLAWLADRPGELTLVFAGMQYQVSLMVAAVAIVALVAAVMILWWLIKGLWTSPHTISRYFRRRRRDRGYQALSTGMVAAGAGDGALARRKNKEAMKLLGRDREPLVHLLEAQAMLLEGDHERARAKFEAMLDDPDMRLLGLRGLYLEAERLGDRRAARHYADQAVEAAPQLGWASSAALEERTETAEWDQALRLVDTQKSTGQIDRTTAERRKAVLLTAKAMAILDAEPVQAKNAALEANRLAPDLVPAAITAARALFRLDDLRKGAKLLESTWKREAHPEIAEAYVHARLGDSTQDRLVRAKRLLTLRQNHPEAALAVARAALAAGEFGLARQSVEAAIRQEPREGAYLLLADVEEAETGDQGRVRQWLGKAVRAPQDPAWVADGYVSDHWEPASPVTGRLDAYEWRAPVERLGQVIEGGDAALTITPVIAAPKPEPTAADISDPVGAPGTPDDAIDIAEEDAAAGTAGGQEPAGSVMAEDVQPTPTTGSDPVSVERPVIVAANDTEPQTDRDADKPAPVASTPEPRADATGGSEPSSVRPVPETKATKEATPADETMKAPSPDDPGVGADEEEPAKSRFRLF